MFLINLNEAKEKIKKRKGESINKFFFNIALELFKWILLAKGMSN